MRPCSFCGQKGPCNQAVCQCAKCVDPERYARWKNQHPWEHLDWLFGQIEDDKDQEAFDRREEELLIEEGIIEEEDRAFW